MTAVPDIVIDRCVVSVVRHGGWSWGANPRRYADRVLTMLPALIAERFADVAASGEDVEITEPVKLAIRLTTSDLAANGAAPVPSVLVHPSGPPPTTGRVAATSPLGGPLVRISPDEPGTSPGADGSAPVPGPRADDDTDGTVGDDLARPPVHFGLLDLLVSLDVRGHLDVMLALLPPAVLDDWYRVLLPPNDRPSADVSPDRVASLVTLHATGELSALLHVAPASARSGWHRTLAGSGDRSVAEIAALAQSVDADGRCADSVQRHRDGVGTVARVATRLGVSATESLLGSSGNARAATSSTAARRRDNPMAPAVRPETAANQADVLDVEIDSALPFLLLGPLAQAGYLDAISPAFELPGLAGTTGLFATALAATVAPFDPGVVTVFAGLTHAPSPSALSTFAAQARAALPALDAVLATSLVLGHTADIPLLLSVDAGIDSGGLVLADLEGLFPMAWLEEVAEALPIWRACGSPTLLVAPAAARPAVLRDLDRAGVTFVIDVPPTRHEPWRRLPGLEKAWTNSPECPSTDLSQLPWAVAQLDELITRLSLPGDAFDLQLRNSATLASSYALGSIAWTLWRDRETAHPLLARERFADLSARVRVDATSAHVYLPLGRRHSDLHDHGWLVDVPNVPWLDGRIVEFSGG
jgi:hypothetical protein